MSINALLSTVKPKRLSTMSSKRPDTPFSRPLPPSLCLSTGELGTTSLQLLQDIDGIRAIQVHRLVHARASPTNLLDDVVWVCGANDGYLGRKPLLEGLSDKVAV